MKQPLYHKLNDTERCIIDTLNSEHCSYKSTKKFIKLLYKNSEKVIHSFGENAGAIDIGDGNALVFKIESHNHPSYIEPYNGAASGVGGILRDIFIMGAKPVALMNSLKFGAINEKDTPFFIEQISKGIANYGNCFGVPMLGGETNFDPCYNKNVLVNVFAAGIARKDKLITSIINQPEFDIYYMGPSTSTDGIGGAIMASDTFSSFETLPPNVTQIADPYIGRCCYDALQEMLDIDAVIAGTDLGAGGLACAIAELALKNNVGIHLELENVPLASPDIKDKDILLSETQERSLLVLNKDKVKEALKIANKWGIYLQKIADSTKEQTLHITRNKTTIAHLKLANLQNSPSNLHNIPKKKTKVPVITIKDDLTTHLINLLKEPNNICKEWIYNQFDSNIQSNTIIPPGDSCGAIRIPDINKAILFKITSTPNICDIDAYTGTKYAVTQCYRSINAYGGTPLAITNNLNFGSPEDPIVARQIQSVMKGLNNAAKAYNMPIISGNVSLYNQTDGVFIKPTPTIAAVGLIDNWQSLKQNRAPQIGDFIYFIGKSSTSITPKLILQEEIDSGILVHSLINNDILTYCEAVCSKGIALTLVKLAIKHNTGVELYIKKIKSIVHTLCNPYKAQYILTIDPAKECNFIKFISGFKNYKKIGKITGDRFKLNNCINLPIKFLADLYYKKSERISHGNV